MDTVLFLCPSLPTETLKWLSLLPILMQESFWWWQCSDRYIISLFPNLNTSPLSPSLISLMVSVDLRHHVYLLMQRSKDLAYTVSVMFLFCHRQLHIWTTSWLYQCQASWLDTHFSQTHMIFVCEPKRKEIRWQTLFTGSGSTISDPWKVSNKFSVQSHQWSG